MNGIPRLINSHVQDAIESGEHDFLDSFQQLCAIANRESTASLHPLCHSLGQKTALRFPRKLSPWAYLGYFFVGKCQISGASWDEGHIFSIATEVKRIQESDEIIDFGDPGRASVQSWQLVLEHFQEGGDFVSGLEAPNSVISGALRQAIRQSRALIKRIDPELDDLMHQLQSLIILATPDQQSRLRGENFGGATCFFFRGASIINASRHYSLTEITEQLIHEYAHAELFVLSQNEALCLNEDQERHQVLIRSDPRPMNGILHSLYVVSRVAEWTHKLLQEINQKPEIATPIDEWEAMAERQHRHGMSSLQCIRKHGRLTNLGQRLVDVSADRLATAIAG